MMLATNIILVIVALAFGVVFFHPKLGRSPQWRATVTPLASIIGSGFLVAGPILAHSAGLLAVLAMTALCIAGYAFGSAIRNNIAHVEPVLKASPPAHVVWIERLSEFALSFAYFISVAYYLNLFAAFGLRFGEITDPFVIRIVSTIVIAGVGAIGLMGGLSALERLEVAAVGLKLSVIGGLLFALFYFNAHGIAAGEIEWRSPDHPQGWKELQVVLGLLILIQGFETSRYLGEKYDSEIRIRTMRRAQLLATGIYISFILLITTFFTGGLPEQGGETAIIDMLRPLGAALPPMIIIAALASQLSAAVADTNGAGGLLSETFGKRVSVRLGNLVTAAAAIAVTWTADIYEIIAYASKAFVVFYGLQSAQALLSALKRGDMSRALLFLVCSLLAIVIFVFSAPAKV